MLIIPLKSLSVIVIVIVMNKAKELIHQKFKQDIGLYLYVHDTLDKGVITNEELKILIENHTGKKVNSKDV